jgi:hypothetical protein
MLQAQDQNGNVVPNTGYFIEQPIIIATGTASTAFLKNTVVRLIARTADCFFRVSTAGTAATTSDHPLPVGGSIYLPVKIGDRIANTGGSLVVSVLGASHQELRSNYY